MLIFTYLVVFVSLVCVCGMVWYCVVVYMINPPQTPTTYVRYGALAESFRSMNSCNRYKKRNGTEVTFDFMHWLVGTLNISNNNLIQLTWYWFFGVLMNDDNVHVHLRYASAEQFLLWKRVCRSFSLFNLLQSVLFMFLTYTTRCFFYKTVQFPALWSHDQHVQLFRLRVHDTIYWLTFYDWVCVRACLCVCRNLNK